MKPFRAVPSFRERGGCRELADIELACGDFGEIAVQHWNRLFSTHSSTRLLPPTAARLRKRGITPYVSPNSLLTEPYVDKLLLNMVGLLCRASIARHAARAGNHNRVLLAPCVTFSQIPSPPADNRNPAAVAQPMGMERYRGRLNIPEVVSFF